MKAYRETVDYMYSDNPEMFKIYSDFVGIPVSIAKRTRDGSFPRPRSTRTRSWASTPSCPTP